MNIFDFDGTIYHGDSTVDFILYCFRKKPSLLRYLPGQAGAALAYFRKRMEKTAFKERLYRMFQGCDVEALLEPFWEEHAKNIYPWYQDIHRSTDIVISASPEFLLRPICRRLGIETLIASRVDPATGAYTGQNCWGEEKVRRLNEQLGIAACENFYSDSYSDQPLADIAQQAYRIQKGEVLPWNPKEKKEKR